ncbi:PREDICTED: putative F-box protein PP2-B6 [Camelina sativa]|uniref:F-box protein PP2-B6 n=1 Tax=Camelina sativa TaxID=90675 RepID=A0ABM0TE36_CAMSA|nr:PREDICTED: putative F-box protein PP2-B6 [Camelina sativa]
MGQKRGVDSRGKGRKVPGSSSMKQKHHVESSGGEIVPGPSPFDDLPEECIFKIISLTSPRDVCISASVSKSFACVVKSDSIWEKFLPSEYESLVPPWRAFSSKKELYFTLCYDPVLIEDGKKSFWLETASGKKCVLLAAKELWITERDNRDHWQWIKRAESSFEKVPELLNICAFEIGGSMSTQILSLGTHYAAYIVYKLKDERHGLRDLPIQVGVGFKGQEMPKRFICFDDKFKKLPKKRGDGWMEAEIGDFFNEGGLVGNDEIEVSIVDVAIRPNPKGGLIIEGIEFRPKG